jgi:hypothetical protein
MIKFYNILLEGKKENLIDKYKDSPAFADAPELLEKLIDGDPSSTKKYSEWLIKQMIGLGDPSTYSVADNVNLFIDLIEQFHKLSTSITPEDIDYAESISALVNGDKIKLAPKDINKYDSIWELQAVMTAVRRRKIEKEKEQEIKKEVNRIYEDDRFLIVEPMSHGASCYYGANTKWCTTTKDDTKYFDRYTEEGSLYYIIDKKSPDSVFGKMALLVRNNDNLEIYDQKDSIRTLNVLLEKFEPISSEIRKLIKGGNQYEMLKKLQLGEIEPKMVKLRDPLITGISGSEGDYNIQINFGGVEKFLSLFEDEVGEDELRYIEYTIEQPYGMDTDYYDPYNWDEELKDGYYLFYLNQEHLGVLKDILELYDPKIGELIKKTEGGLDVDREEANKIGEFMAETFSTRDLERLSDVFIYAKDQSISEGLKKEFTEGLCNILDDITVFKDGECFYNYEISLDEVIRLYENSEHFMGMGVMGMIRELVNLNISFPYNYPYDMTYESEDNETFSEEFNGPTLSILEDIYSDLDDADYFVAFKEYVKLLEKVKEEFGKLGKNNKVPSQEGVFISIEGIDPETNKVNFKLKRFDSEKDAFEIKKGRAKLSSIYNMMNNYSLFDPFE